MWHVTIIFIPVTIIFHVENLQIHFITKTTPKCYNVVTYCIQSQNSY